jgi:hypothetical protein
MDWNITVKDRLMYGLQVGFILLGAYLYDYHLLGCVVLTVSCMVYALILYFDNKKSMEAQRKLNEKLPNYRETMDAEDFLRAIMSDPELMDMTADVVGSGLWSHLYRKYVVFFQLVMLYAAWVDL